jgi:hypothetical protein
MNPIVPHTIPRLNGDLIELIVKYTHPDVPFDAPEFDSGTDYGSRPYRFFAGLCTISSMWLTPGRRQLYRVLRSYSHLRGRKCESFLRTIKKHPQIRGYVRRCHLVLSHDYEDLIYHTVALMPNCIVLASAVSLSMSPAPQWTNIVNLESLVSLTASGSMFSDESWRIALLKWTRLRELVFLFHGFPMAVTRRFPELQ